ncbi:MAG: hypothetical protein ABIO70_30515 [Pseudomonadota bacterium]
MPLLPLLLLPLAFGREVLLRNDEAWDDAFGEDDAVVLLEYPQCAVAVLTPQPEDYPLRVHTVQVYLGSTLGNQDREITLLTLAMHVLAEGEDPRLMGYHDWDWPETAFWVTVSTEYLNGLNLDDPESGIYPLTVDSGRLAVFVCAPDPEWKGGISWPCTTPGEDCSGLVVEGGSPSEGSWIVTEGPEASPLAEAGVTGAWVIRAVGEGPDVEDTGTPDDTGDSDQPDDTAALTLERVAPSDVREGTAALLVFVGGGFAEGVQATIGGRDVRDLTLRPDGILEGWSPVGLPVGLHDVEVTNPDGTSVLLVEAFRVRESRDCGCYGWGSWGCHSGAGAAWLALLAPLWLRRRRCG